MSDALESLNGLIVPLAEQALLLPSVAVAELVGFRLNRAQENAPSWFLGWTLWRDQQVPVVDPYVLFGEEPDETGRQPRTVIFNAIGERAGVHFIAMRVWSIPRSRKVTRGEISHVEASIPFVLQSVRLGEDTQTLCIPDLLGIEQTLDTAGLLRP
jgi:chemosensory pili system protein ChpC